jgi:hypothetical protein
MVEDLETIAFCDVVLQGFKGVVLELNDLSAPEADQVVVVVSPGDGLIPGLTVTELSLGGQAETDKEFQGPIHRGVPDFRVDLRDLGMDLREILVAGRGEEDLENLFTLLGRFQAFFGNPRL